MVGRRDAVIRLHLQRQPAVVLDHRGADAVAQFGEIALQAHIAQPGRGQLVLDRGDGHHAVMGVVEVAARLGRRHPAGALHQDGGDDLQAVGDPMLQLLKQHRLLAEQVVLQPFGEPRVGDVGHRQEEAHVGRIGVVKSVGRDHQPARTQSRPRQIHLIGVDLRRARQGGSKQRAQLRDVPLTGAKGKQGLPNRARRVDPEGVEERGARRYHHQVAVEQKDRGVGRRHQSQGQAVRYDLGNRVVMGHEASGRHAVGPRSESHSGESQSDHRRAQNRAISVIASTLHPNATVRRSIFDQPRSAATK